MRGVRGRATDTAWLSVPLAETRRWTWQSIRCRRTEERQRLACAATCASQRREVEATIAASADEGLKATTMATTTSAGIGTGTSTVRSTSPLPRLAQPASHQASQAALLSLPRLLMRGLQPCMRCTRAQRSKTLAAEIADTEEGISHAHTQRWCDDRQPHLTA